MSYAWFCAPLEKVGHLGSLDGPNGRYRSCGGSALFFILARYFCRSQLPLRCCSAIDSIRNLSQLKFSNHSAAMVGYKLDNALPRKPEWLQFLLSAKFFATCAKHDSCKKNEKNIFCLDCISGICQHCVADHISHRLLQIRRYVYHDVIRLHDIQKLLDCSRVQTYIINSARVVFLNERPQPKSTKGLGNTCESCERSLQDAYKFCSVACKVEAAFCKQGKEVVQNGVVERSCESQVYSEEAHCTVAETEKNKARTIKASDEMADEQLLLSPTSSDQSTATDGFPWESNISPSSFCNSTVKANSRHHPLHLHHHMRDGALKLSEPLDCGSTSPRSVIIPSSLNRRKSKPRRSPLC